MTAPTQTFASLRDHLHQCALIASAAELLQWDERTMMPTQASEFRAEQVAYLSGRAHAMRTDSQLARWLDELEGWEAAADPHSDIGATVALARKDYEKQRRLPGELVESIAAATVRGQGCWDTARRNDDYAQFQPALDEMISLQRRAGELLADPGQSAYEGLLDQYEPGARVQDLASVFAGLRDELVQLLSEITVSARQVDDRLLKQKYSVDGQRQLSTELAKAVGFDFQRGRLDETSHPFCTSLGPSDCRILTRYDEDWLPGSLFGTLHEAGHGMYEQGLRPDWYGLPPGTFVSLGIHESQSRLWENLVGRSLAFWKHFTPQINETFSQTATPEQWHACFNRVQPSLIRVEADEATYNLHIIVRFELEQALISGELSTNDLPFAWNERYTSVIGVSPPSAANGVLQDVHWSAGLFGYFPTYTLGNLIAAQLYESADEALGGLDAQIEQGDFAPLLGWLRENVHTHGRKFTADELVQNTTGKPLSAQPLIASLRRRYAMVYDLA
ncbi:carboxypeptidase M32 [Allorhodopirellula solitaria]|uniref:Metal-dependent carboxypeptidase n=1 Tax=Allorhodopirellula solitaria TaxID=2527987 RepID=A0A5C5X8K6_9BACT|nr:carboxypeptidase M32 [Allorhodopirellula solitaria]TWT59168.1 Thermostable carboxypeptidase 1 [Allorhodopirellula solitaria]